MDRVLQELDTVLSRTLHGERLARSVSSWMLNYGWDDDDLVQLDIRQFEDDDFSDSDEFRKRRRLGKEKRYVWVSPFKA